MQLLILPRNSAARLLSLNGNKCIGRFARYILFLLSAINFARTQGDSSWVQQTVRAKSSACFPSVLVTRPVKRTLRLWHRLPLTPLVAQQHPALHRCRGSRKHHPWPEPRVAAGAAARPTVHSYLRAIPVSPETSVIRQDVPYLVANKVRFDYVNSRFLFRVEASTVSE